MKRLMRLFLIFFIITMLIGISGCSRVSSRLEEKKVEVHYDRLNKEINKINETFESINSILEDNPIEESNQDQKKDIAKMLDELRRPIKVIDRLRPPEILEELHAWFKPYVKTLQNNTNQLKQSLISHNKEMMSSNYSQIDGFFTVYGYYHDTEYILNELGFPLDEEKRELWSRTVYGVLNKSRIDDALTKAKLLGYSTISIDIYTHDNEWLESYIAKIEKEYSISSTVDTESTPEVLVTPPEIIEKTTIPQDNEEGSDIFLTGSEIIPNSDVRRITDDDLKNLELFQLNLAKNEIFARHGYVFKNIHLMYYFSNRAWYFEDIDFDGEFKTEVEKVNVERIAEEEKRRNLYSLKINDVYEAWDMVASKHMFYSKPDLADYQPQIIYSESFYVFPLQYFTPDDITGDMMYAVSLLSGNVYQYHSNGDLSLDFKYDKALKKSQIVVQDITTTEAHELLRDYYGDLEYLEFFEGKMDSHFLFEGSYMYTAGNESCFYYGTGGNAILYIVDKKYGIIYEPVYGVDYDLYYLTIVN